ncbi:trypsin domain-containing protein [Phthorimaea operculella]|nr:trypsin domain-containing protein [Phthorimaea operculella]
MSLTIRIFIFIGLVGCLADAFPKHGYNNDELFVHANEASRVIGGTIAAEGSAIYMAALVQGGLWRELVCGASILTPRTVLTAAHCVDSLTFFGSLARNANVVVGTNLWRTGGQLYELERNITHPGWDPVAVENDIGMIITVTNIAFNDVVLPVRPSWDFIDAGIAVRALGWGRTAVGGYVSDRLLELTLNTIEGGRCAIEVAEAGINLNINNLPTVNPVLEICAVHSPREERGMCNGDSGSPLVRVDNGLQVGIVSWGVPCGRGAPDVFTRVSAYMDWILRNIK